MKEIDDGLPDNTAELNRTSVAKTRILGRGEAVFTVLTGTLNKIGFVDVHAQLKERWRDNTRFWVIDATGVEHYLPRALSTGKNVIKWVKEQRPEGIYVVTADGAVRMAVSIVDSGSNLLMKARREERIMMTVCQTREHAQTELEKRQCLVTLPPDGA